MKDSYISCNTLSNWRAFSDTIFSILNYVLNRIFQQGRIYFTYLFPYRFYVAKSLESGRAMNSVPSGSPRIYCNIHPGKNCRVIEFLCIRHKIGCHSFTKWTLWAVKHYNDWLRRLFYHLFPDRIINFNHIEFVQSFIPVYYRIDRMEF